MWLKFLGIFHAKKCKKEIIIYIYDLYLEEKERERERNQKKYYYLLYTTYFDEIINIVMKNKCFESIFLLELWTM